ncbi:MAG: type IVB secretion system protein IcmH/DotU [Pseudorhodoferax sp.]
MAARPDAKTLLDLMYDGFYMLFLLRNGYNALDADGFRARLGEFLGAVERGSRKLDIPAEDLYLAKYAFCALVDERVLMSQSAIRGNWERKPLQLEMFGEQLAGEHFFDKLEQVRQQGAAKLQVLEVFHMCLLMGFQGKYLIEGTEKLGYLTARLGDEIAQLKGRRTEFAPHALPPDRASHRLRNEVPLWVVGALFLLAGLLAFLGLRAFLDRQTGSDLAGYHHVITLPAQAAHVTITLP